MLRKIIHISEEKCNGCGLCIPNCHEGALQVIDGKARLVSDLFCDGLGACIGHCPEGAIEITEREAEPYNEILVMEQMVKMGRNTILAHLEHLRDHNEEGFLKEAIAYVRDNKIDLSPETTGQRPVNTAAAFTTLNEAKEQLGESHSAACGCPGSAARDFRNDRDLMKPASENTGCSPAPSELRHWPVQFHLINPNASYFQGADVILAADCVAFTMGDFHNRLLKGKSLVIGCPKLDSNRESYIEKLTAMIAIARINTLTVAIMEVPCCGGLMQIAESAVQKAGRKIPVKKIVVGLKGDILSEEWV